MRYIYHDTMFLNLNKNQVKKKFRPKKFKTKTIWTRKKIVRKN